MKLFWLLLCLTFVHGQDFGDPFDYDGEDYNYEEPPCSSDYYEDPTSEKCHKSKHPNKTLIQEFGANVKECCSNHGYIFTENCVGDPHEHMLMCHDINGGTNALKPNLTCPKHCTIKQLKMDPSYEIQSDGTLLLKTAWKDQAKVQDYCASYQCEGIEIGWSKVIEVCLCAKETEISKMDQNLNKNVSRCCTNAKTAALTKKHDDKIFCMNDESRHAHKCSTGDMKSVKFEKITFTSEGISFTNVFKKEVSLVKEDHQYCLGFSYNFQDAVDNEDFIESEIYYCVPETCKIGEPCIR